MLIWHWFSIGFAVFTGGGQRENRYFGIGVVSTSALGTYKFWTHIFRTGDLSEDVMNHPESLVAVPGEKMSGHFSASKIVAFLLALRRLGCQAATPSKPPPPGGSRPPRGSTAQTQASGVFSQHPCGQRRFGSVLFV